MAGVVPLLALLAGGSARPAEIGCAVPRAGLSESASPPRAGAIGERPACASTPVPTPAPSSLLDDLIAFWSLDGAAGAAKQANAGGSCGASCDLTDNNGVAAADAKTAALGGTDGAALFDKTAPQPYYSTSDSALWAGLQHATWSVWMYLDTTGDFDDSFGQHGGNDNAFALRITSTGTLEMRLPDTGTGAGHCLTTAAPITAVATWYHIVVVYDGTEAVAADRCDFYVNDALIANTATGSIATSLRDSARNYTIGLGVSSYFDGRIDAHGFWSAELTTSQITSLYDGLGSGDGVQHPFTGIAWNLLFPTPGRWAALGSRARDPRAQGELRVPLWMVPQHQREAHCARYPEAPVCG